MSSSPPITPAVLPAYFEALVVSSNDAIVTESMDGIILSFNPAAERLHGLRAEDVIGKQIVEVHPTYQSTGILEARMAARRGEHAPAIEATRATVNGLLEVSMVFSPIRAESGEVIGVAVITRDISHRPDAPQELQLRARQQAAVAWFGQRALASTGLEELMSDAVDLISRTLGVEFVKLLEVAADNQGLVLRAGAGWRPELIGTTVSDISRGSPAGLALLGGRPVIVTNLPNDLHFPGPSFLHDHGIVSGMTVVIRGPDAPFGVVGVHSAVEHSFSVGDLHVLEAIANVLASAISRFANLVLLEQRVEESARLAAIVDSSNDAIMSETLEGIVVSWNPASERLYGIPAVDAIGNSIFALIPSAYDPEVVARMERARRGEEVEAFEARRSSRDGTVRDVSIKISPVRSESGEVVGSSAIVRDISERVRIERELQEQRRTLSTLLANLPGMAYRCLNEPSWPMEFVSDGCLELTGYSPQSLIDLYAGYTSIIHPDDRAAVWSSVQTSVAKGEPFRLTYRIITASGVEKWVLEQGCGVTSPNGELRALEGFIADITDRVQFQQELHQRIAQHEAIAQLGQRALASTDLDALLADAMEVVKTGLGVELISILKWYPERQSFLLRAGDGWKPGLVGQLMLEAEPNSLASYVLQTGEPVIVRDLAAETRFSSAPLLRDHGVVSGITVPLNAPDGPLGMLGAHTATARMLTPFDVSFLQSVANVIANAIERTRAIIELNLRVEERTRELRTLLDISHDAAATLELGTLAELILDRIRGVVDYTGAAIYVLDESCEALNLLRYQGPIPLHKLNYRWTLATHDHARATIETARPLIINDIFSDEPLAEALRRNAIRDLGELRADFGSWMSVPMKVGERVIGMLSVEIDRKDCYTEHHAELLMAVADQAAVAVENARLYEQARGLAALEERQKLARDLHDSVSQALFGIGLGARTARTLLDRDPTKVAEPLDYVVSLAEAGLTEMRALIFELRPESLELEGLVGSLEKQLAALRARHGLVIDADLCPEPAAAFNVKEALYRIAQETLNNVVKHARASSVTVQMTDGEPGIRLEIVDDGVGFDPMGDFPGHLGLRSMRERAARIGAVLEVESAPGNGARTRLIVPPAN